MVATVVQRQIIYLLTLPIPSAESVGHVERLDAVAPVVEVDPAEMAATEVC